MTKPKSNKQVVKHQVPEDEARERVATVERLPMPLGGIGEELGEAFVEGVTGADAAATDHRAAETIEERGGPFIVTSGATEFATGTDASNPADAERAGLPTASAARPR